MTQNKKLSSLIKITKGKKVIFGDTGKHSYIDIKCLRDDNVNGYTDEEGVFCTKKDIVIAWDGSKSGTVGYGLEGVIGSTLAKLKITNEEVDTKYLGEFLRSNYKYLNGNVSGVAIPHLKKEFLVNLEIPLPSIDTQRLIVSEIEKQFSRLDEGLSSLVRIKENLKSYRASLMKSAVEGKLTSKWRKTQNLEPARTLLKKILDERKNKFLSEHPRKKYKEPEGIKDEDLLSIDLPEGWEWCILEQITSKITDGTHKTPKYIKDDEINGRDVIRFISAKNIKDFNLVIDDYKFILREEHEELNKKIQLEKGDVFIAKSGSIGQSTVFDLDDEFSIFESLAILKIINKNMSKYLALLINSDLGQKQIRSKSKGVAVQHLHLEDIRKLSFPLPPFSEQNEIVKIVESKLSIVEKLEKLVDANIKKSKNLKQAILKKAFSGELIPE